MSCDHANPFIETVADGAAVPETVATHIRSCARCNARLSLARRINAVLAARSVARAPEGLASAVLAQIRRDRWHAEQVLDLSFNLAVGGGIVLIILGGLGLLGALGFVNVSPSLFTAFTTAAAGAVEGINVDGRTLVVATFMMTLTVAVWWWVEEGSR